MSDPLIYFLVGELSGDQLGGALMKALKEKLKGQVRFSGMAGPSMEKEGLVSRYPLTDFSVNGFVEVIPHIPRILKSVKTLAEEIETQKPDLVVSIDSPDFTLRVMKKLAGKDIPLVHYVAPTVWFYKEKRAEKIAKFLDHLLTLFPFEPPYFEKEGLATTFVGHPVTEKKDQGSAQAFFALDKVKSAGLKQENPTLLLMPGSRLKEIERLLPVFKETVKGLQNSFPSLQLALPVASTVSSAVKAQVAEGIEAPLVLLETEQEKWDAFKACTAGLIASGTASIELSVAGLPHVVGYKLSPLTYKIAKRVAKVESVVITNILLKKPVIPELLQDLCTEKTLIPAVASLLEKGQFWQKQKEELAQASQLLHADECPSEKAANVLLSLLEQKKLNLKEDEL